MKKPNLRQLPKFKPVSKHYKAVQKRMREIECDVRAECLASSRQQLSLAQLGLPPPPPPEDHPSRKEWEKLSAEIAAEIMARLKVFLDHYYIEATSPNAYLLLSLRLADDLIPNFNIFPGNPGRPKSLIRSREGAIYAAVEEMAKKRGRGVMDACIQLQKRSDTPFAERSADWESKKPWSARTLKTRYDEDKARLKSRIMSELIESGEIDARHQK